MTLTFELDLDILPLDLHAKIQVCMFVRSAARARQTDSHTHDAKTITPVADAGCKNSTFASSQLQTTQPELCRNLLLIRSSDVTLGVLDKIPAVLKHMGLKAKW